MAHSQGIKVGLKFGTFTKFEEALNAYEEDSDHRFYRSNSKTLKKYYSNGVYKDLTSEGYKEDLVFREATYKCVTRKTNNQRQKPTNCKALITLGVKDKKLLIIKKFMPEHDHSPLKTKPASEDDCREEATTQNDNGTQIETQAITNSETAAPREVEIELVLTKMKEYLRRCPDDEIGQRLDDLKKMLETWGHMLIVESVIDFPMADRNGDAVDRINIVDISCRTESVDTTNAMSSSQHEEAESTNNDAQPAASIIRNNGDLPTVDSQDSPRTPIRAVQSVKRKHEESEKIEPISRANKSALDTDGLLKVHCQNQSAIATHNIVSPTQNISEQNGSIAEPKKMTSSLPDTDLSMSLLSESVMEDMDMSTIFKDLQSPDKTTNNDIDSSLIQNAYLRKGTVFESHDNVDQNGNARDSSKEEGLRSDDTETSKNNEDVNTGQENVGPTAYAKKTDYAREEMLLRWLRLPEEVLQNALEHNYRIMKHDIDIDPYALKDSFIDDEVKISLIKKFFESKVFVEFQAALKKKKELKIRNCGICSKKIMRSGVRCDSCLTWYHLKCASLKRAPKGTEWFCQNCS